MGYHFGTGGFPSEGVLTSFGRSKNSIRRAKNPGNRCFQLKWQSKVSVKCFIKNNLINFLRYESEFMWIFLNKWMLYRPKWFWQKNRKSDLMNYIPAKAIQPQMDIFFKKAHFQFLRFEWVSVWALWASVSDSGENHWTDTEDE